MIVTCKKQVPFRWIAFAILPWISYSFNGQVMSVALLFSLKKFVENPAGLTFVLSLPGFVSILLVPIVNFLSDRVWSRFGRRKPFIITGWIGLISTLILMPLMPNFWLLLAVYLLYSMFNDIGGQSGPMEPLCQEIVPPHQRGRANGALSWCSNLACMTFYFFALGRFDDVRFMAGVPLDGEHVIYWTAALLMAMVLVFVMLGIKEIDQKSPLRGQRLNLKNFFISILDRDLWPVYTLVFSWAMFNSGLGALGNLLYTDQWNYTKQEMGINVVIGGIINMFIIAFLAIIADKLNRMRAYQVLICVALAVKASYFCYVEFVLADRRPSLVELVVFGETLSIIGMLMGMVFTPLVYDYVTRNKMGTYMAGAGLLGRVTGLITLNGVGLFVWAYAVLFQPPAGDMVRVVLKDEVQKSSVRELIRDSSWTYPDGGTLAPSSEIKANAWYATGLALDHGRCWEIRLHDKGSVQLAATREKLNNERSPLIGDEKMQRDSVAELKSKGKIEDAGREQQKADASKALVDQYSDQIKQIDGRLEFYAGDIRKQVAAVFGDRILVDGEQVLGAEALDAILMEFPVSKRPESALMDKILTNLRKEQPWVIDLRPMKKGLGYCIVISALLPAGTDEATFARDLQGAVERVAAGCDPNLLTPGATPDRTRQTALSMELRIIEEPLDTRISPIMRVANRVLALFNAAPTPDHRLVAIARNLRAPGQTEHVRVTAGANDAKSISVVALVSPDAEKADSVDDPVGRRLQSLLASKSALVIGQARAFYDRVESAAATKRITIARPFVAASYAPMKYDYMCGYIWMFVLGIVGLGITMLFQRRERKGLIHKRGVEEAQAS